MRALLALAVPCFAACSDGAPPPARNLLLVVVDSLRADRLSTYGHGRPSPALDALARGGVVFERAQASAPWTKPSVATMLTGLHPTAHGVTNTEAILADDALTLAEVLAGDGFRTTAVVSHHLIGRKFRFHQGFDEFDQESARGHRFISSAQVTAKASRALEEAARSGERFFLFAHYFDPHYDYRDHPSIRYAKARAGRLDGSHGIGQLRRMVADMTDAERGFLLDRYDEEIRFTDDAIGGLLERLDALGLADDTLVVFTADHGEEFGERGWLGHTQSLYRELVRVPLVVRGPGVARGVRVAEPVSLVALMPTVLERLGVAAPAPAGAPLAARSFGPRLAGESAGDVAPVFCEVDYLGAEEGKPGVPTCRKKAVVTARYKLVRDDRSGAVELYDLVEDPAEARDLARERPEEARELEELLDRHLAVLAESAREGERATYTDEELRELQQLGYVGYE